MSSSIKPVLSAGSFNLNNFKATLQVPLLAGDDQLTMNEALPESLFTLSGGIKIPFGDVFGIPLTIFDVSDPSTLEIVHVVSGGETCTVRRAQEGTAARDWSPGAQVECRLTAESLAMMTGNADAAILIGRYARALAHGFSRRNCIVIGHDAEAAAFSPDWETAFPTPVSDIVVIGSNAKSAALRAVVAIGSGVQIGQDEAGDGSSPPTVQEVVAIGAGAKILGDASNSLALMGTAGGYDWDEEKYLDARGSIAIGMQSRSEARSSTAIGMQSRAQGVGSIALGQGAAATLDNTFTVSAVSLLSAHGQGGNSTTASRRSAMQVVIGTDHLDLASGGHHLAFELPEGAILLIDSLDFIITESGGAGGTPAIKIGTSAAEDDALLAATEITATGLHERSTFAPIHPHGVTSVRIAVAAPASGTLKGKLVVRGYVMEV